MPPVALVSSLETHRDAAPRALALVRGDANAPSPVRVVLAAGKPIVRAGLRVFLELDDRITVFGEAATAEEALALASRMDHGVVLIDAGLPGLDTVNLTPRPPTWSGRSSAPATGTAGRGSPRSGRSTRARTSDW
jgi:CheY-like chemotaxis protein